MKQLDPETVALLAACHQALRQVNDPELGVNVVDLGLIDELGYDGGLINIRYRLTSHDCPVADVLCDAMRVAVETVPGVAGAVLERSQSPWDTSLISPEGRLLLGA